MIALATIAQPRERFWPPRIVTSPIVRVTTRRVLLTIPIILGVSVLTFWILSLIPGNAAQQLLGVEATPQQLHDLEIKLGLNQPAPERYWHWLTGAVSGNLGDSIVSGQSVTTVIAERAPVTAELVALAFIVSLTIAVPMALMSARRPGSLLDRISMFISLAGLSTASYVLGLVLSLIFAVNLGVLPAIGYVPLSQSVSGNLQTLTMPVVAISIPLMCFYIRFLRSDLVDQLQSEGYIDTARAKGIGPWQVLLRHALRNSSFGLVTLVGLNVGGLIGGTVIIEQIFALPGLGQLLLQAINTRDSPVVLGCVIIFATVAVLANLVVDLLYMVLDPRIRYGTH